MQPKCSLLALEEAQFLSLRIGEMLKTESERNRHSGFGGPSKASYGFLITENTQMFVKKTSLKYNHPIILFSFRFLPKLARSALHKNLQDSGIETSPDDMKKLEEKSYTCKLLHLWSSSS